MLSALVFMGCFGFLFLSALSNKKYFKVPNLALFIAFLGVICISSILNKEFSFSLNINAILWMFVFLFYLYPQGYHMLCNKPKYITVLFTVIVVILTALMLISLPMYIYDVDYDFYKTTGAFTNQGFSNQYIRLWGVFQEANYGAVYSAVGLIIAIYLFSKTKKVLPRILLVFSSSLFMSFIVLSGSRTTQLITIVISAWTALYISLTKLNSTNKKRYILSVVSCILAIITYIGIFTTVKNVLPYIKVAIRNNTTYEKYEEIHKDYDSFYQNGDVNVVRGYYTENSNPYTKEPQTTVPPTTQEPYSTEETTTTETPKTTETPTTTEIPTTTEAQTNAEESTIAEKTTIPGPNSSNETDKDDNNAVVKLDRTDLGKADFSNGRLQRWYDALQIFKNAPVFGASPRGIYEFARVHNPDTTMAKYWYSISNVYLEILAETGIVGFIIILFLIIKTISLILFNAFKGKYSGSFLTFASVILLLAGAAFLQSDLFFNLTFGGFTFWLLMGLMNNIDKYYDVTKDEKND